MSAGLDRLRSLPDDEATALLVAVYMNGFGSGALSGVTTFLMNRPNPPDLEHAKRHGEFVAHAVTHGATNDRLGIEEVVNQVEEILTGQDSGPVEYETQVEIGGEQP